MTRPEFDKGIIFRFLVSILLAGAALGLFLYSRGTFTGPKEIPVSTIGPLLAPVDREVDSLLVRFSVDLRSVRRKEFTIPNTSLIRVERRVLIPRSALSIQMNVAFSAMARKYNGRAVASENLKEGTVTIHVEVGGYVIETIVLKPEARPGKKEGRSTALGGAPGRRGAEENNAHATT